MRREQVPFVIRFIAAAAFVTASFITGTASASPAVECPDGWEKIIDPSSGVTICSLNGGGDEFKTGTSKPPAPPAPRR